MDVSLSYFTSPHVWNLIPYDCWSCPMCLGSESLTMMLRKWRDGRHTHRPAGLRWTLHALVGVAPTTSATQATQDLSVFTMHSRKEMSTGKQSQAVNIREEEPIVVSFCKHWLFVLKHL